MGNEYYIWLISHSQFTLPTLRCDKYSETCGSRHEHSLVAWMSSMLSRFHGTEFSKGNPRDVPFMVRRDSGKKWIVSCVLDDSRSFQGACLWAQEPPQSFYEPRTSPQRFFSMEASKFWVLGSMSGSGTSRCCKIFERWFRVVTWQSNPTRRWGQ